MRFRLLPLSLERVLEGIALALFLLVVVALASTYFGHSRSPYDSCYGANGRAVPCAVLEALR